MAIRFSVLSSGSTGNATLIECESLRILLDAGLSAKRLEFLLTAQGIDPGSLSGVLVTHEHADHVHGLGAFARKHKLPVYANLKTWNALDRTVGDLEEGQRKHFITGETIVFGSMTVESFPISHDAAEPVAYNFYDGQAKLSIATDIGYMSPIVREKIKDADVIVLEANHDIQMLRVGKYPWNIKRRILSDVGHLSNEAAGEALCDVISARTKRVYLAHLSREHNMLDLAKLTVNNILYDSGVYADGRNVTLMDTYYDRPTAWDRVESMAVV
jgi:phosphoribosyl 1,2-cyclic phosphodiesterase